MESSAPAPDAIAQEPLNDAHSASPALGPTGPISSTPTAELTPEGRRRSQRSATQRRPTIVDYFNGGLIDDIDSFGYESDYFEEPRRSRPRVSAATSSSPLDTPKHLSTETPPPATVTIRKRSKSPQRRPRDTESAKRQTAPRPTSPQKQPAEGVLMLRLPKKQQPSESGSQSPPKDQSSRESTSLPDSPVIQKLSFPRPGASQKTVDKAKIPTPSSKRDSRKLRIRPEKSVDLPKSTLQNSKSDIKSSSKSSDASKVSTKVTAQSSKPATPSNNQSSVKATSSSKSSSSSKASRKSSKNGVVNEEVCAACSKAGTLICCEGCPLSFHLDCLDPPMPESEIPTGSWFCDVCNLKKTHSSSSSSSSLSNASSKRTISSVAGIWSHLTQMANTMNPKEFTLPRRILKAAARVKHKHVAEPSAPEAAKSATDQSPNRSHHALQFPAHHYDSHQIGAPDTRVGAHQHSLGRIRTVDSGWCHWCTHGVKSGPLGQLIRCDRCSLLWHIDCLPEPMVGPPSGETPWSCPVHLDFANLYSLGFSPETIVSILAAPATRLSDCEFGESGPASPLDQLEFDQERALNLAAEENAKAVSSAPRPVEERSIRIRLRWHADNCIETPLVPPLPGNHARQSSISLAERSDMHVVPPLSLAHRGFLLSSAGGVAVPSDVAEAYYLARSERGISDFE
jgi:hypothetical protein